MALMWSCSILRLVEGSISDMESLSRQSSFLLTNHAARAFVHLLIHGRFFSSPVTPSLCFRSAPCVKPILATPVSLPPAPRRRRSATAAAAAACPLPTLYFTRSRGDRRRASSTPPSPRPIPSSPSSPAPSIPHDKIFLTNASAPDSKSYSTPSPSTPCPRPHSCDSQWAPRPY